MKRLFTSGKEKRDAWLQKKKKKRKKKKRKNPSRVYFLCYLHQRFGLVSLFNGISTFVGYLMPKLFS